MYITFYNSDGAQILINTKHIIGICRNDKVIEIICQENNRYFINCHTEEEAKDKMQGFINSTSVLWRI